jgi:lipopolysaccharide exporter
VSYTSTAATAGLQVVFGAILARLVSPDAYGLVAMAMFVLRFGQYFAQMGIGSAVVQKAQLDADETRAALIISVTMGVAFSAAFFFLAEPASLLYGEPLVAPVVRALSPTFAFGGLGATSFALLRRELRFRRVGITDVVAYLVGYGVVGTGCALGGLGVWSLVAAALSQSALAAIGYIWGAPVTPRLVLQARPYRSILAFGSRVSLLGFLEFLGTNIDTLTVGRLFGAAPLGFYNRALSLANQPVYYASTAISRVLLPAFARIQGKPERLKRVYLSALLITGAAILPMGWCLVVASQDVVRVLLGPNWEATTPILRVVALAAPISAVTHIGAVLCEAVGALNAKLAIRAVHLPLFGLGLLYSSRFGLMGCAIAFALSEVLLHVAYAVLLSKRLDISASEFSRSYVPSIVSGISVALATWGARALASQVVENPVALLGCQLAAALVVFAVVLLRCFRGRLWWTGRKWLCAVLGVADTVGAPGWIGVVDRHLAVRHVETT